MLTRCREHPFGLHLQKATRILICNSVDQVSQVNLTGGPSKDNGKRLSFPKKLPRKHIKEVLTPLDEFPVLEFDSETKTNEQAPGIIQ
jgi:hypothetical protein